MSIRKMIALHPRRRRATSTSRSAMPSITLMYCAKMCLSCADACAAEKMDMRQCIRMCLDCADVCDATANLGLRRTGSNEQVLREMLELCARMCDECAAECEKHDHEHCKLCAQMCRECAEDCRKAAESVAGKLLRRTRRGGGRCEALMEGGSEPCTRSLHHYASAWSPSPWPGRI